MVFYKYIHKTAILNVKLFCLCCLKDKVLVIKVNKVVVCLKDKVEKSLGYPSLKKRRKGYKIKTLEYSNCVRVGREQVLANESE